MKYLIALLAFLSFAAHATVTPSVSYTRTSGTAPLCLQVDASASTSTATTLPFIALQYVHVFGDTGAGQWGYGANTAQSKNFATGPIAAHCYETAETYTIATLICESATSCAAWQTQAITVTAADTTFSATTICIANGSLPVAGSGGCPSGSTARQGTGDWDADMTFALGNNCGGAACKRILFKGGETFTASAKVTLNVAGPGHIGSYGTGKATFTTGTAEINFFTFGSTLNDWRIVDVIFTSSAANSVLVADQTGAATRVTFLRVDMTGIQAGLVASFTEFFMQDSTFGSAVSTDEDGHAYIGALTQSALLGSSLSATDGVINHTVRISTADRVVIANNTIVGPTGAGDEALKIHAPTFTGANYTEKVVVAGNKITGIIGIEPGNPADERLRKIVVESNWLVNTDLGITADEAAIRNNVFTGSVGTTFRPINIGPVVVTQVPTNVLVENNSAYVSATPTTYNMIRMVDNTAATATIRNNLAYAPNVTSPVVLNNLCTVCGTVTVATNSSDAQAKNTNPYAGTPSVPIDFAATVAGYADDGGTASYPATASDFFNCSQTSGVRIGATVPRSLAVCRSAP